MIIMESQISTTRAGSEDLNGLSRFEDGERIEGRIRRYGIYDQGVKYPLRTAPKSQARSSES